MNFSSLECLTTHYSSTGEFGELTLNYQQFIEKMMAAMPDAVYVYDLIQQRNVYANRGVAQILGYTPEDLAAMGSALVMELFHPDDHIRQVKGLQRFEQAHDGEVILSEYRVRHKDGTYHWISMRDVIFQRTAEGKPHLSIS
jgi:PAS domain S-box-containing protein